MGLPVTNIGSPRCKLCATRSTLLYGSMNVVFTDSVLAPDGQLAYRKEVVDIQIDPSSTSISIFLNCRTSTQIFGLAYQSDMFSAGRIEGEWESKWMGCSGASLAVSSVLGRND